MRDVMGIHDTPGQQKTKMHESKECQCSGISVSSSGYNFVIGLLVKPVFILSLADRIKPSELYCSSITLPSGHLTRFSVSECIRTTSPTLITFSVLFPLGDCCCCCRSIKRGRYSCLHRVQKSAIMCCRCCRRCLAFDDVA